MAVAYKSAGAIAVTEASGGALSPACPATVDANDILIAHVWYEGTTTAPSTPSGWAPLAGPYTVESGFRHWVFGKIAAGTEDGAAVAFGTPAVTTMRAGRVYSFSGYVSGTIEQLCRAFAHLSHATDPQMPEVTTVRAGSLAVGLVGQADDNAQANATGETGGDWTLAAEANSAATTPDVSLSVQTASMANPGTITGGSVATLNDPCGVIAFEIRPDPKMFGAVVAPFTFTPVVNSVRKPVGLVDDPTTFGVVTNGVAISPTRGVVSWASLETPKPVWQGAVVNPVTFGAVVAAFAKRLAAAVSPFTFTPVVSATVTARAASATPVTFGTVTNGARTVYGATVSTYTFGTVTDGDLENRGMVSWAALEVPAAAPVDGAVDLVITDGITTNGVRTVYGRVDNPTAFGVVTNGTAAGGGAVSVEETFTVVTAATVTRSSAVSATETFSTATSGRVTARSAAAVGITADTVTNSLRTTYGAVVLPETFAVFTQAASGTQAAASLQLTFSTIANGVTTRYGTVVAPATFTVTSSSFATKTGTTATALTFATTANGVTSRFGAVSLPITFGIETRGNKEGNVTGRTSLDVNVAITTTPWLLARGRIDQPITLTTTTGATHQAYGAVSLPLVFNIKSGNPIYEPGINGHIAFTKRGIARRPNTGRIANARVRSLA